ncbi:hypothetical protein [Selenomonas ruminantium]|nr:hypothetical protein [Selenomonas ruminantium]
MDEAVRLLRAQIILSNKCLEKIKALKEVLQAENKGANIVAAVQSLEPALLELGKLERNKRDFLHRQQVKDMHTCIRRMPRSKEWEILMHLFHRTQEFEESLKQEIAAAQLLLERGKQYVDYHINVMTRTVASDTYTQEAAESEGRRGVRMFDSSI